MTADNGSTLCNRSDARLAGLNALQFLLEVSVVGPNAAYEIRLLTRIRISDAYIKRLIGCVFLRIP